MARRSFWQVLADLIRPTRRRYVARRERHSRGNVLRFEQLEQRQLLTVSLELSSPSLTESGGTTAVIARLSAPETTEVTVDLANRGEAILGRDFTAQWQLVIPAGQTSGSIDLIALDDGLVEPDEMIEIGVASIDGSTQTWDGQPVYATLIDDDAPRVVSGTPANDTLTVIVGPDGFRYSVNNSAWIDLNYVAGGTLYWADPSNSDIDTLVVRLAAGVSSQPIYSATLMPNSVDIVGVAGSSSFALNILGGNIERQYVFGGTADSAVMNSTDGGNFWGRPAYSVMTVGSRLYQATGFGSVTANAASATDKAALYGGGLASADQFIGGPTSSTISKLRDNVSTATVPNYRITVNGFRTVYAYADAGDATDTAVLRDSRANDTFVSTPTVSYMLCAASGSDYLNTYARVNPYKNVAANFRNVSAVSTDTYDTAYLYDSAGNDTLTAYNLWTRLTTASCTTLAKGFRDVIAVSTKWGQGEVDRAHLFDSWADTADRGRDDYLRVYGTSAEMIYGNRMVRVTRFERLNANRTQGGLGLDTRLVQKNSFAAKNLAIAAGFIDEASLTLEQQLSVRLTRDYLRNQQLFNVNRYTTRGTDFLNPEFADLVNRVQLEWSQSPYASLGPLTKDNLQILADKPIYDFSRLETVEMSLAGIDRHAVLQRLFDEITRNAATDLDRHLAIDDFTGRALQHTSYVQPLRYDPQVRAANNGQGPFVLARSTTGVYDPLILLELAEGRCGHKSMLNVDLYCAVGYRGRLIKVTDHTIAEVYYGNQWHMMDSMLFGGQASPVIPVAPGSSEFKVPSLAELSSLGTLDGVEYRYLTDALPFNLYPGFDNRAPYGEIGFAEASWFYFGDDTARLLTGVPLPLPTRYPQTFPYFYREKTGNYPQWQNALGYGWNMLTETSDRDWTLYPIVPNGQSQQPTDLPLYYQPAPPQLTNVTVTSGVDASTGARGGTVQLTWNASVDGDNDVVGYRVFVGRTSRGWNYDGASLPDSVMPFKSNNGGWTPAMYKALYAAPPGDVMVFDTTATSALLKLPQSGDYYITVMAYDAHGEAVGRKLYLSSEEIKVTL